MKQCPGQLSPGRKDFGLWPLWFYGEVQPTLLHLVVELLRHDGKEMRWRGYHKPTVGCFLNRPVKLAGEMGDLRGKAQRRRDIHSLRSGKTCRPTESNHSVAGYQCSVDHTQIPDSQPKERTEFPYGCVSRHNLEQSNSAMVVQLR